MSTFTDLLQDPKERERLGRYAVKENPNISDFSEFEEAFKKAFSGTSQGSGLLSWLNDEESKLIFESDVVQRTITENKGNTDDLDFEVQRDVDKGVATKPSQIRVIEVPKKEINVSYEKNNEMIHYTKSKPHKFGIKQIKFLQVRKQKGIPRKEAIKEYNQFFKDEPRSESSITSKFYRL